jgi:hypothetical protein
MPGDITSQAPVLIEHDEAARIVKPGRTHSGPLRPRPELVERAAAAGNQRKIVWLLRPKDDGHDRRSVRTTSRLALTLSGICPESSHRVPRPRRRANSATPARIVGI